MSRFGISTVRPRTTGNLVAVAVLALAALAGCSSSKSAASDDEVERQHDIAWLTDRLADEGIFVAERGEAEINVAATLGRRLRLDERETVDAYWFDSDGSARDQGTIYTATYPRAGVYVHGRLLVVRHGTGITDISVALTRLLGETV